MQVNNPLMNPCSGTNDAFFAVVTAACLLGESVHCLSRLPAIPLLRLQPFAVHGVVSVLELDVLDQSMSRPVSSSEGVAFHYHHYHHILEEASVALHLLGKHSSENHLPQPLGNS
jgi:hypothetical protein